MSIQPKLIRARVDRIRDALNDPNAACWVTNDERALVDLATLVEAFVDAPAVSAMTYNQRCAFEALKEICTR